MEAQGQTVLHHHDTSPRIEISIKHRDISFEAGRRAAAGTTSATNDEYNENQVAGERSFATDDNDLTESETGNAQIYPEIEPKFWWEASTRIPPCSQRKREQRVATFGVFTFFTLRNPWLVRYHWPDQLKLGGSATPLTGKIREQAQRFAKHYIVEKSLDGRERDCAFEMARNNKRAKAPSYKEWAAELGKEVARLWSGGEQTDLEDTGNLTRMLKNIIGLVREEWKEFETMRTHEEKKYNIMMKGTQQPWDVMLKGNSATPTNYVVQDSDSLAEELTNMVRDELILICLHYLWQGNDEYVYPLENKDGSGYNILHWACLFRLHSVAEFAIKARTIIDGREERLVMSTGPNAVTTIHEIPLDYAVRNGDTVLADMLLNDDPDGLWCTNKTKYSLTVLGTCSANPEYSQVTQMLLSRMNDISAVNWQKKEMRNPQGIVVLAQKMFQYVMEDRVDDFANFMVKCLPLLKCTYQESVMHLKESGESRLVNGDTVLHVATRKRSIEMVKTILSYQPEGIMVPNAEKQTPQDIAKNMSVIGGLIKDHMVYNQKAVSKTEEKSTEDNFGKSISWIRRFTHVSSGLKDLIESETVKSKYIFQDSKESIPSMSLTDQIGSSHVDSLEIYPVVNAIAEMLNNSLEERAVSVGLMGQWGIGKTFVLKELRSELDKHALRRYIELVIRTYGFHAAFRCQKSSSKCLFVAKGIWQGFGQLSLYAVLSRTFARACRENAMVRALVKRGPFLKVAVKMMLSDLYQELRSIVNPAIQHASIYETVVGSIAWPDEVERYALLCTRCGKTFPVLLWLDHPHTRSLFPYLPTSRIALLNVANTLRWAAIHSILPLVLAIPAICLVWILSSINSFLLATFLKPVAFVVIWFRRLFARWIPPVLLSVGFVFFHHVAIAIIIGLTLFMIAQFVFLWIYTVFIIEKRQLEGDVNGTETIKYRLLSVFDHACNLYLQLMTPVYSKVYFALKFFIPFWHDPEPVHEKYLHVELNPWLSQREGKLWATLLVKLYTTAECVLGSDEFRVQRFSRSIRTGSLVRALANVIAVLVLFCILLGIIVYALHAFIQAGGFDIIKFEGSAAAALAGIFAIMTIMGAAAGSVLLVFRSLYSVGKSAQAFFMPMSVTLKSTVDDPKFKAHVGYLDEVKEEVKFVISVLRDRGFTTSVYIDDLDRASPEAVSELLSAVQMLLVDDVKNRLFCTMAIDPRLVEDAIESNAENIVRSRGLHGAEYLQKLIQVPINLPTGQPRHMRNFLNTLLVDDSNTASLSRLVDEFSAQSENNAWCRERRRSSVVSLSADSMNADEDCKRSGDKFPLQNENRGSAGRGNVRRVVSESDSTIAPIRLPPAINLPMNATHVSANVKPSNLVDRDERDEDCESSFDVFEGVAKPVNQPRAEEAPWNFQQNREENEVVSLNKMLTLFVEHIAPNPRRIKRIVNLCQFALVYETGSLYNHIPISMRLKKLMLLSVLTDQWPYRMCWIQKFLEHHQKTSPAMFLSDREFEVSGMPISYIYKAIEHFIFFDALKGLAKVDADSSLFVELLQKCSGEDSLLPKLCVHDFMDIPVFNASVSLRDKIDSAFVNYHIPSCTFAVRAYRLEKRQDADVSDAMRKLIEGTFRVPGDQSKRYEIKIEQALFLVGTDIEGRIGGQKNGSLEFDPKLQHDQMLELIGKKKDEDTKRMLIGQFMANHKDIFENLKIYTLTQLRHALSDAKLWRRVQRSVPCEVYENIESVLGNMLEAEMTVPEKSVGVGGVSASTRATVMQQRFIDAAFYSMARVPKGENSEGSAEMKQQ